MTTANAETYPIAGKKFLECLLGADQINIVISYNHN
jgi:hypothetical protein